MEELTLQQDPQAAEIALEFALASLRARGGHVLCVHHADKKVRAHLRKTARRLKGEGRVSFFIPGEQLSPEDAETRYLLEKFPEQTAAGLPSASEEVTSLCV